MELETRKEVKTMPGGDRTGPMGMGPMTGRAAGFCAGFEVPGVAGSAGGRGFRGWGRGRGSGRGRGWRNRYHATGLTGWQRMAMGRPGYPTPGVVQAGPPMPKEQELEALKRQAEYLQQAFEDVSGRIQALESPDTDKAE